MLPLLSAIIFLILFKLTLAGKDASSYLLKDKIKSDPLTNKRIKRWHRDGVLLDTMNTLAVAYIFGKDGWFICVMSLLIRLSIFDLAFNRWASLNIHYLGSTAWADKQFVKLFGINGAVKKSLFFAVIGTVFFLSKFIFKF